MWVKTMDGKLRNLYYATFIETREVFQQTPNIRGYTETLDENGVHILRTVNVVAYLNGSVIVLGAASTDDGLSADDVRAKADIALDRLTHGLQSGEGLVSLEYMRP